MRSNRRTRGQRKRRLLLAVLAALLLSLLPGVVAQAATPTQGATFNVPRPWGTQAQQYRNLDKVVSAVRSANPGSRILLTSYLFDRSYVVDSLVAACRRGVAVRLILDGDVVNNSQRRIVEALTNDQWVDRNGDGDLNDPGDRPKTGPCNQGDPVADWPAPTEVQSSDTPETQAAETELTTQQAENVLAAAADDDVAWGPDRSYVTSCKGSCRGGPGNMHTKVYAFSSTGSTRNVLMVSSANLNEGGAVLGWNDMYTMVRRPTTFAFFEKIHRQMTNDRNLDTSRMIDNQVVDGPFVSRFFPLDNAGKAKDPVLQDLNRIRCSSSFGRTQIHVSMFYWKGPRGDYLATKLLNLAGSGCRVSIIYGAPSVAIATRLRNAARAGRIQLFDSRWDFNNDGYNEIRTHAKYVLVKGTYAGNRAAHVVMTGSQNWVAGSLTRSDESSLNIEPRGTFAGVARVAHQQYVANWTQIRNHSRKLPYH
jgi:hypothetical protein